MFKSISEFNNAVYDFLNDVLTGEISPVYFDESFATDTMNVIDYCVSNKYVSNIQTWKDGKGDIRAHTTGTISITRDGLAFIENYNGDIIKKANRKAMIATIQSWIAILVSVVSVIISVLTYIGQLPTK